MAVNIRVAGEAGQGIETAGGMLTEAFASIGLHVFSTASYMSRVRGGLNWFDIRIGDTELFSGCENADLLVALTSQAADVLAPHVDDGGTVLTNGYGLPGAVPLPFDQKAKELTGSPLMANTIAAGTIFALLGYDIERLGDYLESKFKKKGSEVVEQNLACARLGAELASSHLSAESSRLAKEAPAPCGASSTVGSGSEAVGLAAAAAGVKFVSSYPMTPSTGVFTFLAGVADEYGIVVEQAEDEIAAINMICGATYAGVPAMTTTSGGGFALMCEGISLAGMLELPAFILLSQRPGPATGLPTRTGQEDLRMAIFAGHGDFPRAIFAPGSAAQAYTLTRRALETAHRFQSPVILMIDQFLADQRKNLEPPDGTLRPIDRHIEANPPADYVRYALAPGGVSPRALPGGDVFIMSDSDEHTENGHLTENLHARVRQQDKRLAKNDGLTAEFLPPARYGPMDANTVLIAWGSTYGPCREAVDLLAADGESVAMLHFAQVWPLDAAVIREALQGSAAEPRRIVSVEGNSTGQFASILRQVGALDQSEMILKYNGLPFTGEEIASRAKK